MVTLTRKQGLSLKFALKGAQLLNALETKKKPKNEKSLNQNRGFLFCGNIYFRKFCRNCLLGNVGNLLPRKKDVEYEHTARPLQGAVPL